MKKKLIYQTRPISINNRNYRPNSVVWFILFICFFGTLIGFLALDPNPSFLLAFCSAVNISLITYTLIRLHHLGFLLSPISIPLIGVAQVLYYSWGNLGARIQGDYRYLADFGALSYYPRASLLSTLGLVIYCIIILALVKKEKDKISIKFKDLNWKAWQGLVATIISIGNLVLLTLNLGGLFSEITRLLTYTYSYFFVLALVINLSVLLKTKSKINQTVALICLIIIAFASIGDRSRSYTFISWVVLVLCWIAIKPWQVKKVGILSIVLLTVFYTLSTIAKYQATGMGGAFAIDNIRSALKVDPQRVFSITKTITIMDAGYRTAGFELPATILMNFDNGLKPMYGKAFLGALIQGIPSYFGIGSSGNITDRIAIYSYFRYKGYLADDEVMGIPLAIGLADFGIPGGILIYIFMAFCYWALWRIIQISPYLYLSFIMIAHTVFYIDLFWGSFFSSLRALAFCCIFLWLFGFIFMPNINKNPVP